MAPPSMWLAACSVMMLYVAVPHASCHPTPDDASHHEVMPYSQQHDPQPYYYDEEEEYGKEKTNLQDYEPVLAERQLQANTVEEAVKLSLRAGFGALYVTGFCLFVAYVYAVPWALPHVRAFSDQSQNSWGVTSRLDPVDVALNLLRVEEQPNSRCRERLVCDARRLASAIPYVDYYLPHATSREDFNPNFKYEEAAFVGAEERDCSIFSCPQTSVQMLAGASLLNTPS